MFVAVLPPAEVVEDLDAFLDVRRSAAGFRWAALDQLHVTLAFLAAVPDRTLDDLLDRLGVAASRRTRFKAALSGGGAFPDVARARVLWAGLDLDEEGSVELSRLAAGARAAAGKAGIAVDGRRFRPHVTVARSGLPEEVSRWVRLLDAYRGPSWAVDEISLIASHLGEGSRRRPRYETVATFPLTGP